MGIGRVISTALQFIDGFTKPSKQAIDSIKRMGREIQNTGRQIQNAGKAITATGSTITAAVTLPIVGVATAAVKTAADFEQSMSQVAATMGKTKDDVKGLSELAQQMGATTAFSASEAAEGINILAMAGLNAIEIGDSLGTVLDLAAAGAINMGNSASYIVGAVKGFGDEMKNASLYADLMAKGATLANTDVAQFGEAISFGAATAAGYNQSVDSLTLSLLRMAEQNVTGQTAVIGLNSAMKNLYAPTDGAKKALDSLGISAYNADGSAREFNVVVDELSSALKGLTDENANALKATIFTANGMETFNKMTKTASGRVNELREELKEAGGSAGQQAKTQLGNLNGQLTLLKSAIEATAITIGNKLLPHVSEVVEWAQKAFEWINSLSDAQVENIMKWAGIAAAIGPAIMMFGKMVTMVGTAQKAWGSAIKIFTKFGGAMGVITSPAAIVIGVLAAIALAAFLIIKNWDHVEGFLINAGEWFKNAFDKAGFSVEDFKNKFSSIGRSFGDIAGKIGGFCSSVAGIFKREFSGSISGGAAEVGGILELLATGVVKAFNGLITSVDTGMQVLDALLDFFTGAFAGDWDRAAQGFKDSLAGIFSPDMAAGLSEAFDAALPAIKAATEGVKAMAGGLVQDAKKILASFTDVFRGVGDILRGILTGDAEMAFKGFRTVAEGAIDVVGGLFKAKLNAIKNFVTGALSTFLPESTVSKIAGVFDAVAGAWDIAIGAAKGCVSGLAQALRPIIGSVKTIFNGLAQFIKGAFTGDFKAALNGFKTMAEGAFSGLVNVIKAPFMMIAGMVKGAVNSFKGLNAVKSIFSGLGNTIKRIMARCGVDMDKFSAAVRNIKARVGSVINGLRALFRTVFNAIGKAVKDAATVIAGIFGYKVSSTCSAAKAAFIALRAVVGASFVFIGAQIKKTMAVIVPVVKVAFGAMSGAVSAAVNSIASVISGMLTIFDGLITFITGVFTGNWRQAWEGVRTIFSGIFDTFAALCKTPINAVIGIINGAISGLNSINVSIPDWVPGLGGKSFGINIPTIPMLYRGTDNWKGGMAMIHDRGGEIVDLPEGSRVYPHDKSVEMAREDGARNGSGSVSVIIQKLADKIEIRSDEDIDRIAAALAYRLKKVAFNTGTA